MAAHPDAREAMARLPGLLAELLGFEAGAVGVESRGVDPLDALLELGEHRFVVGYAGDAGPGPVAATASRTAGAASELGAGAIPLVVVPYMGVSGQRACERAGVAWLDLSGNARIVAPGLRVLVEGRPNRFPTRGRPSSAFAPKSSRVARLLLMRPDESFRQRDISTQTGVSEGYVSRIVARLEDENYIARDPDGAVRVRDPALLLEAWEEDYDFSRHRRIRGHVAARSGAELSHRVAAALDAAKSRHAATGLSAAWQLVQFAGFRLASFYVDALPDPAVRKELGFREGGPGTNLWLLLPDDEGVFHGAEDRGGIRCVHAVQAYLDLGGHPEGAREAAGLVRRGVLGW